MIVIKLRQCHEAVVRQLTVLQDGDISEQFLAGVDPTIAVSVERKPHVTWI
jgi:hypothetical protein